MSIKKVYRYGETKNTEVTVFHGTKLCKVARVDVAVNVETFATNYREAHRIAKLLSGRSAIVGGAL